MLEAEKLDRELRIAMPELWRMVTEDDVRARLTELNERIADYNRTTTWERQSLLTEDVVEQWRRLRR